jgi:hypothetical protein
MNSDYSITANFKPMTHRHLIGGITAAAAVAAGLITFFLLRRRRRA